MNAVDPSRRPEALPPGNDGAQAERNWAMAAHLAGLAGYLFPLGHLFGPLLVWLLQGDRYPLVNDQGKEALNFQISMTLYMLVAVVLILVVIGLPLLILLGVFQLIMVIIAAVRSRSGERYRYPFTIRLIT